jgi:hypothetical protein
LGRGQGLGSGDCRRPAARIVTGHAAPGAKDTVSILLWLP